MISKANLHGSGAKLANYLAAAKDGEWPELAELRGFASDNIHDAFLDVEIQAGGTACEKPFFHCYVRLPEDEQLSREQWLHSADRIEKTLGFSDQPRAVVFHHSAEGTHMHVAWSRIDTENMCAIDPGLYKNKLKQISRELEQELGLTLVSSERAPEDKTLSASRNEFEQSRRLNTDLKEIRETIRDCWEHSDNGQSFAAALEHQGLKLARGDKRDFVVVDHEGGIHALGKRITGATAQQTRGRLADLDREQLPGVEQARAQQLDRRIADLEAERTAQQSAERTAPEPERGAAEAHRAPAAEAKPLNRTAGETHLAYTLSESAQGFIEALEERGLRLARVSAQDVAANEQMRAGYQQYVKDHPKEAKAYGIKEPPRVRQDELVVVSLYKSEPRLCFLNERTTGDERRDIDKYLATFNQANLPDIKGAAHDLREAAEREATAKIDERPLSKTAGEIRLVYELSQSGKDFVDGLEERGLRVARVRLSDVLQNEQQRADSAEFGLRPPPALQFDELVVINRYGSISLLNERTTGDKRDEIAKFLSTIDRRDFSGVSEIRDEQMHAKDLIRDPELQQKSFQELRELRAELRETRRDLRQQLADEELLPTARTALQEREAEVKNCQADVRLTINEMCLAQPELMRDESAPFRSTEAREMSLEGRGEWLASGALNVGKELGSFVAGFADFACRTIEGVADFFFTPSPPTPEIIHARREAKEEAAEAASAARKDAAEDDRQSRIAESVRQMKEREEQYRRLQENEIGGRTRDR